MLNHQEYEAVIIAAYEMRKSAEQEDGSLENLKGLFLDLVRECGPFWPLASSLMGLLQKDAAQLSAWAVYKAGQRFGMERADLKASLFTYLSEAANRSETLALNAALQNSYELLAKFTGKKELIAEFMREHRRLYGPSSCLPFFQAGYETVKKLQNSGRSSK